MRVGLDGGDPQPTAEVAGGAHMSFSPDGSLIADVVGHKTVWISPLGICLIAWLRILHDSRTSWMRTTMRSYTSP